MTVEERAIELIADFGHDLALKAVQHLSVRDKQWITKLSEEDPKNWSLGDGKKIDVIYNHLIEEIKSRKGKTAIARTNPSESPKTKVKVNNEPTPL